jgi:hypothetical protein
MSGVLITFIIFVLFPGIILGFILLSRYLRYKETQTMIEHGITPPPPKPVMPAMPTLPPQAPPMPPPYAAPMPPAAMRPMPPPPVMPPAPQRPGRAQLTWGLVLSGVGIALTLALWPIGFIANSASGESGVHFPLGLGPWMLGGFIPLFVGIALILAHVIAQPERGTHQTSPQTFANGVQAPAPYPVSGSEPPAPSLSAESSLEPAPTAGPASVKDELPPPA